MADNKVMDASKGPQADAEDVAPPEAAYDELPDAPPRQGIRLSWLGLTAAAIVTFWVIIAIIGPWIAPFHVSDDLAGDDIFLDPNATNLLGSDASARDVLSRVLWGAQTTIGISFAATLLAYAVGITLGFIAAVSKDTWLDTALSRVNDAILALPSIMLGLIIVAAVGSTVPIMIGAAGLIYATSVFRISRALGQDIMVQDFVEAARARGEGLWWVISREVLPNAFMPLLTDFGLRLVFVILFISTLSFLGLGIQPPLTDWGSMVNENRGAVFPGKNIWAVLAPSLAIASLTISINIIVDDISAQAGGSLAKKMV
ncbi:MAG: ABC transporter permease [Hyphomicrobiaceae bacterium]